jgi:hypothetical protein
MRDVTGNPSGLKPRELKSLALSLPSVHSPLPPVFSAAFSCVK